MKLHSLRSKISLIFFLAFLSLSSFFAFYLNNMHSNIDKKISLNYEKYSSYFREIHISPQDIEKYLKNFDFKVERNAREILRRGQKIADGRGYQTYLYQKNYYYHVQRKGYRRLFRDFNTYQTDPIVYIGFSFMLFILIFIYLWLLKSLKPLKELQHNISKFAQGDLSIQCQSDKKDEIAIVSNEFDNAVKQINLLLQSRQLFLRTIMHELKTPIAKGRIVSSLIEDEIQEKRLIFIFEKLEYLINDFAKIEEIISNNYTLNKQRYKVNIIIKNATQMLLLDTISEKIDIHINNNSSIHVDIDLFAMVIKNLLDNAIKYSTNHKAILIVENNTIEVISEGKPLNQSIEKYFKAFHNEINMNKQGMGLGLYIIKSILDMHQMHLEYQYKEGQNSFKIIYLAKALH